MKMAGIEAKKAEFRKEMVFEGEEKQLCLTVYSVESEATNVDYHLRRLSAEENFHVKYISFKNNNSNEKISGLKINKLINVKLKYDWLEEVSVFDKARFQGKKMYLSQVLMKAKKNGMNLITGVEQGCGRYNNRVYFYYKSNVKKEINEWIQTHYGQDFTIEGKARYKTSMKEMTPEERTINKANTDYILERLKEIEIDETSKRSYSQVVQQNSKPTKNDENENEKVNSDDETCVTSNKSSISNQSFDTMTEISEPSKQEQMSVKIDNLQQVMEKCLAQQEKMNRYIDALEDCLVSLADSKQGSKEHEEAQEKAELMKKQIKKRKAVIQTESINDEEKQSKKRMAPKSILKRPGNKEEKEDDIRKGSPVNEEVTMIDERTMNQNE